MTTKAEIIQLLRTNDKAVARALVVLNERQTADEQRQEDTKYLNGEGFRPCNARMGTSMANFYLRNGYLTPKQIAYWRKPIKTGQMRIEVYAGQLLQIAIAKANKQAVDTRIEEKTKFAAWEAEQERAAFEYKMSKERGKQ